MTAARYRFSATGNSNYGWFGGGSTTLAPVTLTSIVDRIDFFNDILTSSPRGPLANALQSTSATGNSNYGWFFGGGATGVSTIQRIDFSNDSATASARGPLSSVRTSTAATGNSNYGWIGGSVTTGPTALSIVSRIDFSNDLPVALVRGSLSLARYRFSATGNSNYGWFGGGTPSLISTVDRINFSNDLIAASPRGPLSLGKSDLASTSGQAKSSSTRLQKSGSYGWFAGGFTSVQVGTVDRIDFSNDSITATPRTSLSATRHAAASAGNSNYGWFGGAGPAGDTRVDRINFSNDSATASPRGPLSLSRGYLAATGNSNYGWFGGGVSGAPVYSRVDRIIFYQLSSC